MSNCLTVRQFYILERTDSVNSTINAFATSKVGQMFSCLMGLYVPTVIFFFKVQCVANGTVGFGGVLPGWRNAMLKTVETSRFEANKHGLCVDYCLFSL